MRLIIIISSLIQFCHAQDLSKLDQLMLAPETQLAQELKSAKNILVIQNIERSRKPTAYLFSPTTPAIYYQESKIHFEYLCEK
jgi:hypothetical protein